MKRLVFDLDGTLTHDNEDTPYALRLPNLDMIKRICEYKSLGFEVIIMTARNMKTYQNSVGLINANTLPIIIAWLNQHQVPYDEIHVGKPWCGEEGFYVDDKAIRPDEFINLSYDEICQLISSRGNDGK